MNDTDDGLTITEDDGVFHVSGEIDASTVDQLKQRLDEADGDVVVDLSGVEFIDSSGLRVLIGTQQALEADGRSLTLRSPSRSVQRLFELSSVDSYFTIE